MQKITKDFAQNMLNSFSGDYRELFFEKLGGISLQLLNGKIEPVSFSSDSGFSILSRTKNKEYFKSYSSLENTENEILNFSKTYNLENGINEVVLNSNKSELEFSEVDTANDLSKFTTHFLELNELIKKYSFIKSYNIFLRLSYRSYIVANSKGFFNVDTQYYNSFYIILSGEKDSLVEEIFEKITGVDIVDKLDNLALLKETLEKAIKKLEVVLNGQPSPSGFMDVVIGGEAGGTIIHEAVGHGLEADLLNSSAYKGKLGQKVASETVNVLDDPTRSSLRGYYSVDHEGVETKKTYLIKDGVLVSYLHNHKTAELFETESTGHGRREDYSCNTLVRMGSTYLDNGKDKKEDIISKIQNGIYVSQMGGGQVNTTTGDFVFKVAYGFLIKDGKLGPVIRGANISGNGPEMLRNIFGICNDLDFFDGGTCGKGQQMPVSEGNPTFWTKLKVSGLI